MLNRENILSRKLPTEIVHIPEWGGDVIVRRLTAGEFSTLLKRLQDDPEHAGHLWIVAATCDEAGNRLFLDEDVEKMEQTFDYITTEKIVSAILRLNPLKDEAAKNSQTQQPA